jgi:DNA-binding IclR family transcriptional regulator
MSSIAKLLSILELFSEARPFLCAEEVAAQLDCSLPTAYRYVRELVESGMLVRFPSGEYGLGPRIIKLDYHLRVSDRERSRPAGRGLELTMPGKPMGT